MMKCDICLILKEINFGWDYCEGCSDNDVISYFRNVSIHHEPKASGCIDISQHYSICTGTKISILMRRIR